MTHNLYDLYQKSFSPFLSETAIVVENDISFTYQDIDERCAQYANLFQGLNIKSGDRIVAQVEKSYDALMIYFACLRAGIIYLPLNTAYQTAELEYFFADAQPKLVITSPDKQPQTKALLVKMSSPARIETLSQEGTGSIIEKAKFFPTTYTNAESKPDDVAIILYTSGTTGKPKGVMLTHENLSTNGFALSKHWNFNHHDVLLHALPIYHVHGLLFSIHCMMLSGATMIFLNKFTVDSTLENLPKSTVMMGVPTYYTRLLNDKRFNASVCQNMRLFISGSAPMLANTFAEFASRTQQHILERYGMTETGVITSNPLDGTRKPGCVGQALSGTELRIADDQNNPLPNESVGNIQVRGKSIFKGYWRQPEKTAREMTEGGFFNTGDQGLIDEEGYLTIVGRAKDMIISGGLNVYPKEVERHLDQIDGVVESAVVGVPDADFGEIVTAMVVRDPAIEISEQAIITMIKTQIAGFKAPKRICFVDALPRNAMGKVQKSVIREILIQQIQSALT